MAVEPSENFQHTSGAPAIADECSRFLDNLKPVVEALGCSLVMPEDQQRGDIGVQWEGEMVAYVRGAELHSALDRLVAAVEREFGSNLENMSRAQKQSAVRRLDELGAFLLRGAVEDIAKMMGVSRVTLYSYLNAIRPSDG